MGMQMKFNWSATHIPGSDGSMADIFQVRSQRSHDRRPRKTWRNAVGPAAPCHAVVIPWHPRNIGLTEYAQMPHTWDIYLH